MIQAESKLMRGDSAGVRRWSCGPGMLTPHQAANCYRQPGDKAQDRAMRAIDYQQRNRRHKQNSRSTKQEKL